MNNTKIGSALLMAVDAGLLNMHEAMTAHAAVQRAGDDSLEKQLRDQDRFEVRYGSWGADTIYSLLRPM